MSKKLIIPLVVVASVALTAGIVNAAGLFADSLRVGQQGVGGVTFFNGTIVNETTGTGNADNPVTFGDNVRIDGRVWRGATAGTADTMPFIVNDNMEVKGTLTVDGGIAYDNTVSGLSATTVQDAIDEIGAEPSMVISGSGVSAASNVSAAALTATTWTGYAYRILNDGSDFETSDQITLTFTPTSSTAGTYEASPINPFDPHMGGADFVTVGLTGKYKVLGDKLFVYDYDTEGAPMYAGMLMQMNMRGNQMELINITTPKTNVTILTKE